MYDGADVWRLRWSTLDKCKNHFKHLKACINVHVDVILVICFDALKMNLNILGYILQQITDPTLQIICTTHIDEAGQSIRRINCLVKHWRQTAHKHTSTHQLKSTSLLAQIGLYCTVLRLVLVDFFFFCFLLSVNVEVGFVLLLYCIQTPARDS